MTSQLLLITIRKKSSQTFSFHISAISSGKGFFHGTKNKTISAHNRCRSNAFCGAAAAFCRSDLCSTAGRPGTAHSGWRHPGSFYQRTHDWAGKTAETPVLQGQKTTLRQSSPSPELLHHPAGCCAGVGAGADIADPGAGAVFSQPLCTDRSKHPPLDRLSQCTGCRHGVADELAGGHRLGAAASQGHRQHRHCAGQCGRCRICHGKYRGDRILCSDHLRLYVRWLRESLPSCPHTGLCLPETQPLCLAAEVLPTVPAILRKLSDRAMQRGRDPWRSHGSCVFRFQDSLRQPGGNADRHLRHYPLRRSADLLRSQRVPRAVGGSRSGRALSHCLPCRAVY